MAGKKIIVADDEQDLVTLVAATLEGEGYEVRSASNGQEALQIAKSERPDLMVLDGLMPRMSGFDVCKTVKEEIYPEGEVKVLLMTAIYKKRQQKYEAMELYKVDQVIYKPFELDDFLGTVKELLGE
jgi:DNA-binding response OmpR family regulator